MIDEKQGAELLNTLELLGLALAHEGHVWSDEERSAYDRALTILIPNRSEIVYSEPVSETIES